MPDLRDILDAEARRVRGRAGSLGAVLARANRRRRTRRIATGVLALAVAGAGFGLAYAAFRPGDERRPTGPVPGPTPSPTRYTITISNASGTAGAAELAEALLRSENRGARVELRTSDRREATTTIFCHPILEGAALALRDRWFPGAQLRPRIDPESLLIEIGDDFVRDHPAMVELFTTVRSFMTRRVEGTGAEVFLADDAAERFGDRRSGLSLYGYAEGGAFVIDALHPGEDGTALADVIVVTPEGGDAVVVERLTVGDNDPEDGRAEILAAELVPPDLTFERVRAFVRLFLDARREASGAGAFLGEAAREAYASHEGGLDLLRYAADEDLRFARVVKYDRLSPDRHRVVVLFVLSHPAPGEFEPQRVYEALTVERLDEDELVVADAERAFFS